jgi:hypothetical protein
MYCVSLWIAAPVAWVLGDGWLERALAWPALSGAALVVDRFTHAPASAPAMVEYLEEADDGLLRAGTDNPSNKRVDGLNQARRDAANHS